MKKLKKSSRKKIKLAIFISDVGFGHMARQRKIIYEFFKQIKNIEITIINSSVIKLIKEEFKERCNYLNLNNNIKLYKTKLGKLDILKTRKSFKNWRVRKEKNILLLQKILKNFNFIISDFVPEAFELAEKLNIPSYGICHYTWSWFMGEIGVHEGQVAHMNEIEKKARKIFFPPFVPQGSIKDFKKEKILNVNFIVNQSINNKIKSIKSKKVILIMDSGTKILSNQISKTLYEISNLDNYFFYIGTTSLKKKDINFLLKQKNIIPIEGLKNVYSEINNVDYVVARAGFNTLSECIIFKKPTLFVDEDNNPEINENIKYIKKFKLGSIFSSNDWKKEFPKRLNKFVKYEAKLIQKKLRMFTTKYNGDKQIINYIKKDLAL